MLEVLQGFPDNVLGINAPAGLDEATTWISA
jgi:hypothetical protein